MYYDRNILAAHFMDRQRMVYTGEKSISKIKTRIQSDSTITIDRILGLCFVFVQTLIVETL